MIEPAQIVITHKAEFDQQWLPEISKPWVCSMEDIVWPVPSSDQKLVTIALAHGIAVKAAHRAMTDVNLIVELLEKCCDREVDLQAMFKRAMRPKVMLEVTKKEFDEKMNAKYKEAGFRWDTAKRSWRKRMAYEDVVNLVFEVHQVNS